MSSLFVGANISNFYRSARPRYPSSTVDAIFKAWKHLLTSSSMYEPSAFKTMKSSGLALDVACGSGQLTELLGSHFSRIVASDISATQISTAKEAFSGCANIEFIVGDCYSLKCPDLGADLITVAQALHWFDVPRFYAEVTRCLKPTGALALLTYGFCSLREGPAATASLVRANSLLHEYSLGDKYIGPYWDSRRALVDSKYATLPMYNERKCIRLTEDMTLDLPLSQFVAYLKSQSAYHTYLETAKPSSQEVDVLNVFINEFQPLVADFAPSGDSEPILPLVFPLTVIVSVK